MEYNVTAGGIAITEVKFKTWLDAVKHLPAPYEKVVYRNGEKFVPVCTFDDEGEFHWYN